MKLILLGYMGVGKTSIAKKIAKKSALPCFDLDTLIEEKTKMSISDIFLQYGEVYFRKMESEIFKTFLAANNNYILSLGGGTPCYANNHLLLQEKNCISVYLQADALFLTKKLQNNKEKRPLIQKLNEEELFEFVAKQLFERSYYYSFAKYKIAVANKSKIAIVKEILELFQ